MYINISIHDYLRVLARAHLKDTSWTLDPGKEIPLAVIDPKGVLRGQKNQVSVEFNLLYRFHSSLPRRDVKWTNGFFQDLSKGFVKDEKDRTADGGPYLTLQQLDTFGIQIPVMGAAIAKMYATLPKVEDKGCAKAFPIGLDPLFGGKQGEPMKYRFSRDPETLKFSDVELAKEVVGFNFPLLCNTKTCPLLMFHTGKLRASMSSASFSATPSTKSLQISIKIQRSLGN